MPSLPQGFRRPRQGSSAFPSPVVMLSIIAVAMAGIAFVVTRDPEPTEREITIVARDPEPSSSPSVAAPRAKEKTKPVKPEVKRGETYVEVYNNSGITGLASQVATAATDAGWTVVGDDNWYGTIPASTVYHPPRLERAAKLLALDLGIDRTELAVDPMRFDRLTVILTSAPG